MTKTAKKSNVVKFEGPNDDKIIRIINEGYCRGLIRFEEATRLYPKTKFKEQTARQEEIYEKHLAKLEPWQRDIAEAILFIQSDIAADPILRIPPDKWAVWQMSDKEIIEELGLQNVEVPHGQA